MSIHSSAPEKLAVFGGKPEFAEPLHVNRPNIGDREQLRDLLDQMLESRRFSNNGPLVTQLENEICARLQVPHCVAASSGTSAMAILIRALGLTGEVILPAFTFISTAHVLEWAGITPVFADIDPATWMLSPGDCEKLFSAQTSAIIPTHLWGGICDLDGLQALAAAKGVPVIFDAAHAFGCTTGGHAVGGFGAAEVFSFHATKVFHTFEGGAITTHDGELAARLRLIRNFGFSDYDQVDAVGINGKMSEIHAAIGLCNLSHFENTVEKCRDVVRRYRARLSALPGLEFVALKNVDYSNCHYAPFALNEQSFGMSRDHLIEILQAENVFARRYFHPGCHAAEPYRTREPDAPKRLPSTTLACKQSLVLPAGATMSPQTVERVCALLHRIAEQASNIERRIRAGSNTV